MPGPLEGIKVVEMGVWVAGPAAGLVLGDWGAEVIKIEPPGIGDPARGFAKMLGGDLPFNPPFEMDNRSKRSIVLDLSTEDGRSIAEELLSKADVFVTNIRLAALERLGLAPDQVLERHPRLVYGAITGYGMQGDDADRAAYDIAAFWARSGIASTLTTPGSPPPFQRGGMGDHGAGMTLAGAVSAALYSREQTGRGQLVSTSLLRQGIYTLSFDLSITMRFGVEVGSADRTTMPNPTINVYRDKEERWFWIVGLEGDRHWPPLARAVEHPEWIDDPRFATLEARAQNARELIAMLDEIFATKTRADWKEHFDREEDFWWSPVQSVAEVLEDPQTRHAGGFAEVPDNEGHTLLPATPADFHGTPGRPRAMAPELGADSEVILGELGHEPSEIDAFRKRGALG